jgi:ABC-type nitrate/sulfonate/bicarbonate transport system permease component
LAIAAAILCSCYHYLVARSVLSLESGETRAYVAREITLQILLFHLLSQIWQRYWNWFEFAATYQPAKGLGVLITLIVLLFFINWIFRSNFDLTAERCGIILKRFHSETWKSACGFLLLALSLLILWHRWHNSPIGVVQAGYHLLAQSEFYRDVRVSLLELLGGTVLGGSIAILMIALVSADGVIKKVLFLLLPLSNISPIVMWLFSWVAVGWILPAPRCLDYWHKDIAVGCLPFFPFVQALWGLHDRPLPYRILLAIDNALPVAFVAMCYGEIYAATAGLGFMMIVAYATSQFDKGLAGFLVAVALLMGLSCILKWTVRRLYVAEISA